MPIELSKKKNLQTQVATQIIIHTMVFLSKQTKAKHFFFHHPSTMPPHEHDRRPDPTLILQGVCHVQPSKHGLGNDYPITPLDSEELKDRDKSKRMIEIFFFFKTYIYS